MKRIGCATAIAAVLAAPGMASAQSGTITYRYDDNGRLVVMTSPAGTTAYGYDAVDNRTRVITSTGNLPPLPMQDEFNVPTAGRSLPVLANDVDPNNNALTITAVSPSASPKGAVQILPGSTAVSYTPTAGATGDDSFTYTVTDGQASVAGTRVIVHIGASSGEVNLAPTAVGDTATVAYNGQTNIDVRANDSDPNGDTLTVTSVTQGTKGLVTHNGALVTYKPNTGQTGSDSFSYTISDGRGGTATATVSVTISEAPNQPPVAVNDSATTWFNTQVQVNVLANDTDPNSDVLTVTGKTNGSSGGLVTIASDGKSVTYKPGSTQTGSDSFTYTISDGRGGTSTATVNVTITNRAPTAGSDSADVNFNTPKLINVLANDTDPDSGQTLTITGKTDGSKGTVTFTSNTLTYAPSSTAIGSDSFTYTVSDGYGGTATGTVSVNIINHNPIANPDSMTVPRNSSLQINPLTNDTDQDPGQTRTITGVTNGSKGTATFTANSVTYQHTNGAATGGDNFQYTISDGYGGTATGTVNVAIYVPNNPPTAVDDYVNVPNHTAVGIAPFENDTDPDPGQTLSLHSWTNPSKGVIWWDENNYGLIYQPTSAAQTGADSFTYVVKDTAGGFATGTVYLTIAAGNSPPVANNDSAGVAYMTPTSINVLYNDTDPDGTSTMQIQSATNGAKGSVSVAGNKLSVTYTSYAGQTGSDSFTYTIRDGSGATSTATVTVNINSPNPPNAVDDYTPVVGSTPVSINVLANDTTPSGTSLSIANNTQPAYGTLSWSGGTVTYTYTGPHNATSDQFQYTVTNGSGTDTATVYFSVTGGPTTAPIARDDGYDGIAPNGITVVKAGTGMNLFILNNDGLPSGTKIDSVTQGAKGTVTLTPASPQFPEYPGGIGYTPFASTPAGEYDYFTYTLKNGAYTSTANVRVRIAD